MNRISFLVSSLESTGERRRYRNVALPWLRVTQGSLLPQPTQQLSLVTSLPHKLLQGHLWQPWVHGFLYERSQPQPWFTATQSEWGAGVPVSMERRGWAEQDHYLLRTRSTPGPKLLFSYAPAPSLIMATLFRNR